MSYTQSAITIKDGSGTNQTMNAYNDGTNNNFVHGLLDGSGNLITLNNPLPSSIVNNISVANSAGFTRPANTTAYVAGYLVANSTTAGSVVVPSITVARAISVGGFIPQIQLIKTSNSLTNAIFRVHFYNVLPTVSNGDGAAWLSPKAGYLGSFDVTMTQAFSDPAAQGLGIPNAGAGLAFTPVSGAQTLYYLIEARAAYTPSSAETFSLNVWVN